VILCTGTKNIENTASRTLLPNPSAAQAIDICVLSPPAYAATATKILYKLI